MRPFLLLLELNAASKAGTDMSRVNSIHDLAGILSWKSIALSMVIQKVDRIM